MALFVDEIVLHTPCDASWDAMTKVASGRHCAACDLTVHDLSSITEREVRTLMSSAPDGTLCVHYVVRSDGTIRTAPETVIPPSRLLAKAKPMILAATTMFAAACDPRSDVRPDAAMRVPHARSSSDAVPEAKPHVTPTYCDTPSHSQLNGGAAMALVPCVPR